MRTIADILRAELTGKRLIKVNGEVTGTISDVRIEHVREPDTPANDWWGNEYDELMIYFQGENPYGTPQKMGVPVKECLLHGVSN